MELAILNNKLESIAQFITLLFIFLFVLGITYFSTKWMGNIQKNKLSTSNIKVIETIRISNSKYIQIVKIGKTCFAIAVCKDNVTYLCEINEDDLNYNEVAGKTGKDSFMSILEKLKKDKPIG